MVATPWLVKLLMLPGEIPHKARMPTMLHQRHLLIRRRQQLEARHTRKLASATDINKRRTPAEVGSAFFPAKNAGVSSGRRIHDDIGDRHRIGLA
jgi:hypothetical protein